MSPTFYEFIKIRCHTLKQKNPSSFEWLEGLHPVYLTLFYVLPDLCLSQSETNAQYPHLPLSRRAKMRIFQRSQNIGKLARQVFWLPRPFSNLPIPIGRNSGIRG
jgi:hypothetical protein